LFAFGCLHSFIPWQENNGHDWRREFGVRRLDAALINSRSSIDFFNELGNLERKRLDAALINSRSSIDFFNELGNPERKRRQAAALQK
jgi:hypothetical protein